MAVFFDYLGLVLYNIIGNNYMEDLKQLRQQINDIDQEMVKLFERRMKVSSKIAQFKRENNLPIYDKKREEQVLKRNCSLLKDTSLNDYCRIFQNQLMDLSKQYQNEINCERNTINIILDKCGYNITIDDNLINDINKVFYLKRKVLFIYDDNLSEEVVEKVEGLSVASVRATLSLLATKKLCSKVKDIYEGKEKTKFTAVEVSE